MHPRDDALAVLKRLREMGHVAYFAGGCVRDLLLGAEPKDFDVATDAPPDRVRQIFRNAQAVGAAFGVILVRQGGSQIEVATFRAEAGYDDGRHPSVVKFTTAEKDAQRRDFTINGLFFDPVTNKVIDYVGGQDDINARVLRAIGEPAARFDEDSLRLLRAIRFSARLNFTIEPDTAAAIKQHAPQLKRISPERIADELRRMLTPITRAQAWRQLWSLDLAPVLFRFLTPDLAASGNGIPMFFEHVAPGTAISFGFALAAATTSHLIEPLKDAQDIRALFSPASAKLAVRTMRQTLKISNEESDEMYGALAGIDPPLRDEFPRVAQLKRFLAEPTASQSRQLMEALASAGHFAQRIADLERDFSKLARTEFAPQPLIDGDTLTELGLHPGPLFKRILHDVYDAQLEGRVSTREQAIALAMIVSGTRLEGA